jgi:hypothetical protein
LNIDQGAGKMKIAVIGGAGAMARTTIKDLS